MYAKVKTVGFKGLTPFEVDVEATISNRGIPRVEISGLVSRAVSESITRIRTAFNNLGLKFPNKKIVLNLAPAELIKSSSGMDLAIAASILYAQYSITPSSEDLFIGELSSSGILRATGKELVLMSYVVGLGKKRVFLPKGSFYCISEKEDANVYEIYSLLDLLNFILGKPGLVSNFDHNLSYTVETERSGLRRLEKIAGNELAKRALTISAAGRHNILFTGPAGVGKSILADCAISLLPSLKENDAVEILKINEFFKTQLSKNQSPIVKRPFICPHNSFSLIDLIGSTSKIGYLTLAHKGVLFLDEFHLLSKSIIDALRIPLETRQVSLVSKNGEFSYPADVLLILAVNSCFCGNRDSGSKACTCNAGDIKRYGTKLSGPIMDRIDLCCPVVKLNETESENMIKDRLSDNNFSKVVLQIENAAKIQESRLKPLGVGSNSQIPYTDLFKVAKLSFDAEKLLSLVVARYKLSTRSIHKAVKVARTIADLAVSDEIKAEHLSEALQYRLRNLET